MSRGRRGGRAALAALAALTALISGAGCAPADDDAPRCEVVSRAAPLSGAERALVGEAAPYPADPTLRAREAELVGSQRARRQAGWAAAARALAPVALAQALPAYTGEAALPRWRTWYGRDDLARIFEKVWSGLPAAARAARAPLPDDALDAALAWNVDAVEGDPAWTASRWDAYLAGLDDAEAVGGLGGIARVGYDPAAARHLLESYAEQVACLDGAPPAFVDGSPAEPTVQRVPLRLAACEARELGPWFVASGESLTVGGDAAVAVFVDARAGAPACEAEAGARCEVAGPATVWVTATAGPEALDGELAVAHAAPDAPWAACLRGRMPPQAALVKADWRRASPEFPLVEADTSAAGLAAMQASGTWPVDGTADPGPGAIYTVQASSGNRFRLAALHLMTRELDHWLWVTLWWSPRPDEDFGADRPAAMASLGPPWDQYKLCAVAAFDEGDADPTGGYAADHPSLAASLAAVHRGAGGPSWCSNPFIEQGHGNGQTNCVGCHQHGGAGLLPADILADEARFPERGRRQLRNNFPADYSWATDRGDQLAELLRAELEYWDDVP